MSKADDVYEQLEGHMKRIKLPLESKYPDSDPLRRCLVAAAFLRIAVQDDVGASGGAGMGHGEYRLLGGEQAVSIHPSSVLFGRPNAKSRKCVVYNDLVFTTKAFICGVTVVDPSWLTELVGASAGAGVNATAGAPAAPATQ
jgi:hypothetical protein